MSCFDSIPPASNGLNSNSMLPGVDCVTLCLACLALGAIRHDSTVSADVTMLAHASWLVLLLVGRTVAQGIPRHGLTILAGVTMLELLSCLALALPGFTMALGIPRPGFAALLVGSTILTYFMVSLFIINLSTVITKFLCFLFLQEVGLDEGIEQQPLWQDLFIG